MYNIITENGKEEFCKGANMGHCGSAPYGKNYDGCTSVRPEFTMDDYTLHRPSDGLPHSHKDLMYECGQAYSHEGIIRNIVDLMVDFTVSGIKIAHPTKSHEKWYQNWFNRVCGPEVSERLIHNLLVYGVFIARCDEVTLTRKLKKDVRQYKANAKKLRAQRRGSKLKIPGSYTTLNPCMIEVLGGHLSTITNNDPVYGIKLPFHIIEELRSNRDKFPEILEDLPSGFDDPEYDGFVPLEQDSLKVIHFKKNDWEVWSDPILLSILQDVKLLRKLRLADFAVLDSAMDMVRVWKLGDFDNRIMPEQAAFDKLSEALEANNMAGIRNIIWTQDIDLIETKMDGLDILGGDKYVGATNRIHAGMGVPPTLTGSHSTGGSTNNLTSLKTLVKRLIYVRQKLISFWRAEFDKIRRSRGHRICPSLEFDILNLGDEEAEKKIWIDLVDRNILSQEWLQLKMGADPEVEQARQNREHRERLNKKRVPRGAPGLYDPQLEEKCKKSLVETGKLDPRTLNLTGVEEDDFIEAEPETQPTEKNPGNKVRKTAGRPPGTKDGVVRKRRAPKPVTRAARIWAKDAQEAISTILNSVLVSHFDKKNMRSLSSQQSAIADEIKMNTFFNLQPSSELTEQSIGAAQSKEINMNMYAAFKFEQTQLVAELGRDLTLSEKQELQRDIYIDEHFA